VCVCVCGCVCVCVCVCDNATQMESFETDRDIQHFGTWALGKIVHAYIYIHICRDR